MMAVILSGDKIGSEIYELFCGTSCLEIDKAWSYCLRKCQYYE